jgi:hypothetical protein
MSTRVNLSNSWPKSISRKHRILKNQEAQFSINQKSKEEIEKKSIIQKGSKQKLAIKRIRIKCEIKINKMITYNFVLKNEIENKKKFKKN